MPPGLKRENFRDIIMEPNEQEEKDMKATVLHTDGETVLLCRVKDAGDLYQKMLKMVNLSRSHREQMGLQGREKVRREFEKNMVVQKTVDGILGK